MKLVGGYINGTAISRIYNRGQLIFQRSNFPLRTVVTQNRGFSAHENRTRTRQCFRWPFMIAQDCSSITLSFFTWFTSNSGEGELPNSLDILECCVENNTSASVPVTFGASRSLTIGPSDVEVQSSEMPASVWGLPKFTEGEIYWAKGIAEVPTTAGRIPYSPRDARQYTGSQVRWYNPSDTTASDVDTYGPFTFTGTAPELRNQGFCPFVLGKPLYDEMSIWSSGDSIGEGIGDTTAGSTAAGIHGHGSVQYSMRSGETTGLISSMNFCKSGNDYEDTGTRQRHFIQYARGVLDQYGANNLGGTGVADSSKLTELQDWATTFWDNARTAGAEFIMKPALISRVDSTDNWATPENQLWDNTGGTISFSKWGPDGIAEQFNAWLETQVTAGNIQYTNPVNRIRDSGEPAKVVTTGAANYAMTDNTHPSTAGHGLVALDYRDMYDEVVLA